MKKAHILILAFLVVTFHSKAQQTIAFNDAISINIPKNAEKLTKQQALDHASKKFKENDIVNNSITRRSTEHIYRIDDVLISLFFSDEHNGKKIINEEHLLELKKGFDGIYRLNNNDKSYSSVIKRINNNSVLITNYVVKNVEYYRFFSISNNSRAVTGILEFNVSDEDKAKTILDDLLKSIKIKD